MLHLHPVVEDRRGVCDPRWRHYEIYGGVCVQPAEFHRILDDRVGCEGGGGVGQLLETRMQSVNGEIDDLYGRPRRRQQER